MKKYYIIIVIVIIVAGLFILCGDQQVQTKESISSSEEEKNSIVHTEMVVSVEEPDHIRNELPVVGLDEKPEKGSGPVESVSVMPEIKKPENRKEDIKSSEENMTEELKEQPVELPFVPAR